jgi:hypothetical protein
MLHIYPIGGIFNLSLHRTQGTGHLQFYVRCEQPQSWVEALEMNAKFRLIEMNAKFRLRVEFSTFPTAEPSQAKRNEP